MNWGKFLLFIVIGFAAQIIDGTLGMAGHSSAMLQAAPQAELCALDRDEEALELARRRLEPFGGRVHTYHCRYSQFEEALDDLGWDKVDAVLLDIGVSSLQLDEAERGFSFYGDGPLDMRMDRTAGLTARTVVNEWPYEELRRIFADELAEIQRIKSEGDYEAARRLVEQYGVKVEESLHQEVLDRYAGLHLAPYKGFINPRMTVVRNEEGQPTDVALDYTESYTEQMLRYGRDYGVL